MKNTAVVLALMLASWGLSSCSSHDDLPPQLTVMDPPLPQNLVVETVDYITYALTWEIADPSVVSEYRLYWKFSTTPPELLPDTVDTTTVSITVDPPVPVVGLVFCVSSVTIESIESSLVCGTVEEPEPSKEPNDPRPSVFHLIKQE